MEFMIVSVRLETSNILGRECYPILKTRVQQACIGRDCHRRSTQRRPTSAAPLGMEKASWRSHFTSALLEILFIFNAAAGTLALHQLLMFILHRHRLQVLPLEAIHDESNTKKQREQVQGSIGLCLTPATDGVLSRLQDSIDAKKVFLEVCGFLKLP